MPARCQGRWPGFRRWRVTRWKTSAHLAEAARMSTYTPAVVTHSPAPVAPSRAHAVPYRIRFDECGPDGLVRASALLRYVQDAAWVHSDSAGFGRAWYADRAL